MAEAVRKSRLLFLKFLAKLFASTLSLLGVLSGCDTLAADYGVEGVYIGGTTFTAEGSLEIPGIQITLSSIDSTEVFDEYITDENGFFNIFAELNQLSDTDSLRLRATDIDGEVNGSFATKDTLLFYDSYEGPQEFDINLFLESTEGDR